MRAKPAYSLIFAFLVMTVILLVASTTADGVNKSLVYVRGMEAPPRAQLSAESAAELGVVAMKDSGAGYEVNLDDAFTEDSDSDGTTDSWADYIVYSEAQENDNGTGSALFINCHPILTTVN